MQIISEKRESRTDKFLVRIDNKKRSKISLMVLERVYNEHPNIG